MEISTEKKKGPGRPSDPNAIKYRSIGLRPKDWEYFKQWQSPNDEETNFTHALENLIAFAREFAPGGPMVEKPRDSQGRFLPGNGTSKMAICRRKRRERRALVSQESDMP
jgi:hypothetical protein